MDASLIREELDRLDQMLKEAVGDFDLADPRLVATFDEIFADLDYYVAIVNPVFVRVLYFCRPGRDFLGMPDLDFGSTNLSLISKVLSKDNAHILTQGVAHYTSRTDDYLPLSYKVKRHDGAWRWMYSVSKLIQQGQGIDGITTLTLLYDIEDQISEHTDLRSRAPQNRQLNTAEHDRLDTLTDREREILLALHLDMASSELADHLNISRHTFQTHLRSIKKKLDVKTKFGLFRYADHLENGEAKNGRHAP